MEWDYVACLYPEGNIGEDYNVFFQQEEVAEVLFVGCSSPYDQEMQAILSGMQTE